MSNQVLNSVRFARKNRRSKPNNRLYQYAMNAHDVNITLKQREININNCVLGGRVNIEPSLVDFLMNPVLKVKVAATGGGSKGLHWAVDLIRSIEVRSGSNVIMSYNPYRVFLQWATDRLKKERRDKVLELFGTAGVSADTVYIPLPYPGSQMYYEDWDPKKARPLSLGSLTSKSPIQYLIEFNNASNMSNGNVTTFEIESCVLQYDELITSNPAAHRRPFNHSCIDIKIFPTEQDLSAGAESEVAGLESLQGSVKYYWISALSDANKANNSDKLKQSRIDEMELILDGITYYKTTEALQQVKDTIFHGIDSNSSDKTSGANYVTFSRYPNENVREGFVNTAGVKRISLKLKDAANQQCFVCAAVHRHIYSNGGVLQVKEE